MPTIANNVRSITTTRSTAPRRAHSGKPVANMGGTPRACVDSRSQEDGCPASSRGSAQARPPRRPGLFTKASDPSARTGPGDSPAPPAPGSQAGDPDGGEQDAGRFGGGCLELEVW